MCQNDFISLPSLRGDHPFTTRQRRQYFLTMDTIQQNKLDIMMHKNEPNSFEFQNNQPGVFLKMADYQQMLKALEVLKSTPTHHAHQNQYIDRQPTLTELLNRVATEKERMTLTYQKKVFLVAVPIEDVEIIEQLEDCIDIADIEDARQKGGKSIPWEQIEKELRL